MKISHYLYNAFIIETSNNKIAIDPGALFFYFFRFTTLIPKTEWEDITHILVTHGDPDHYWHADRAAKTSNAHIVCNRSMVKTIDGEDLLLGPRSRGLSFTTHFNNLLTIEVGAEIEVGGVTIRGVQTTHGSLLLKFGPFSTELKPGPHERVGWGAIGFSIEVEGKKIVNLGDTLLHTTEWESIQQPDVLMIPIGGKEVHNTMDELDALKAVEAMQPKLVIPCHYNCPAFFTTKYNPADVFMFKSEVEKLGVNCAILNKGDSINI
ncbi:MAG: MBL fold metallo-hydrolase [Candidatus Lindowbacteria bacterium]|nr:MBL fold metallo-hydrolase [Candidatus Lindowbacteria bacterium]